MNVVMDDPLKVGDVIRFEIYLLHKKDRVTVYSEVKWVGPKSAGLYFLMMRPEETDALRAFLETVFAGKSLQIR